MYNPTRRNRNIGTAKQGHGSNNKLTIPSPCVVSKDFYERLGSYEKVERLINGHAFLFIMKQHVNHVIMHVQLWTLKG